MRALSKERIGRLSEYIHSPYFKVRPQSIVFFDYLMTLYPDFQESKLDPDIVGRRIKGIPTLSAQSITASRLLQSIQRFLAYEDWERNEMDVTWHQFNALKQLNLFEEFDTEYQKILDAINEDPEQDIQTFFNRHLFTDLSSRGFDALLKRTIQNDLTPTLKTLDEFYALKLLRYMCEAISRKQILGTGYDEAHIVQVLKILKPFTNEKYPYPYLFINVYRMMSAVTHNAGEPHYRMIKEFASKQTSVTLPASIIESMSYAINWCLYWYGKGYEEMGNEYLWWTQFKMKYSLLLENGKLMPITFRNVVSLAVLSNQPADWMHRFIE